MSLDCHRPVSVVIDDLVPSLRYCYSRNAAASANNWYFLLLIMAIAAESTQVKNGSYDDSMRLLVIQTNVHPIPEQSIYL